MRVDRRFLIVVGLSLVWAFVVSMVFYRAASNSGKKIVPPVEKPVVVAVGVLPLGSVVRPESVRIGRLPEKLFPQGGFSRVEDVVDRPVVSPIQPNEPVIEARLGVRGSGGGVAPLIPTGLRAVSVRVNDVVGVAGFVLPGMRVDVLVTGHPPGYDDTVTTTVLKNISVLSAGTIIQVDAKSQSISAPVVTLLVTPEQAETLTLANTEGKIQLVLRNSADQELPHTPGNDLRRLYAVDRKPAASGEVRARPVVSLPPVPPVIIPAQLQRAPEPERVLVIRGNQKTEEPLGPTLPVRPQEVSRAEEASRQQGVR